MVEGTLVEGEEREDKPLNTVGGELLEQE